MQESIQFEILKEIQESGIQTTPAAESDKYLFNCQLSKVDYIDEDGYKVFSTVNHLKNYDTKAISYSFHDGMLYYNRLDKY